MNTQPKVKFVTVTAEGDMFSQYCDSSEVEDLANAVRKAQPDMAHFVNGLCTHVGILSKQKCTKIEETFKYEIN